METDTITKWKCTICAQVLSSKQVATNHVKSKHTDADPKICNIVRVNVTKTVDLVNVKKENAKKKDKKKPVPFSTQLANAFKNTSIFETFSLSKSNKSQTSSEPPNKIPVSESENSGNTFPANAGNRPFPHNSTFTPATLTARPSLTVRTINGDRVMMSETQDKQPQVTPSLVTEVTLPALSYTLTNTTQSVQRGPRFKPVFRAPPAIYPQSQVKQKSGTPTQRLSKLLNIFGELPSDPTKKVGEMPSAPTKKVGETPSAPTKKVGELPSAPTKKVSEMPSAPTKKLGELPSAPTKKLGEMPSASTKKFGELPSAPTKKLFELPSAPTKKYGELTSAPTQKLGDLPLAPTHTFGDLSPSPSERFGNLSPSPIFSFGDESPNRNLVHGEIHPAPTDKLSDQFPNLPDFFGDQFPAQTERLVESRVESSNLATVKIKTRGHCGMEDCPGCNRPACGSCYNCEHKKEIR